MSVKNSRSRKLFDVAAYFTMNAKQAHGAMNASLQVGYKHKAPCFVVLTDRAFACMSA